MSFHPHVRLRLSIEDIEVLGQNHERASAPFVYKYHPVLVEEKTFALRGNRRSFSPAQQETSLTAIPAAGPHYLLNKLTLLLIILRRPTARSLSGMEGILFLI